MGKDLNKTLKRQTTKWAELYGYDDISTFSEIHHKFNIEELRKLINKWQDQKRYFQSLKTLQDMRMISTVYEKLRKSTKSQF